MYDSLRMQSVQTPIIPVVAELIRQHPGTISLGQGVVHYQPPQQALDALGTFGPGYDGLRWAARYIVLRERA